MTGPAAAEALRFFLSAVADSFEAASREALAKTSAVAESQVATHEAPRSLFYPPWRRFLSPPGLRHHPQPHIKAIQQRPRNAVEAAE